MPSWQPQLPPALLWVEGMSSRSNPLVHIDSNQAHSLLPADRASASETSFVSVEEERISQVIACTMIRLTAETLLVAQYDIVSSSPARMRLLTLHTNKGNTKACI